VRLARSAMVATCDVCFTPGGSIEINIFKIFFIYF
jgi:hypothetical protein